MTASTTAPPMARSRRSSTNRPQRKHGDAPPACAPARIRPRGTSLLKPVASPSGRYRCSSAAAVRQDSTQIRDVAHEAAVGDERFRLRIDSAVSPSGRTSCCSRPARRAFPLPSAREAEACRRAAPCAQRDPAGRSGRRSSAAATTHLCGAKVRFPVRTSRNPTADYGIGGLARIASPRSCTWRCPPGEVEDVRDATDMPRASEEETRRPCGCPGGNSARGPAQALANTFVVQKRPASLPERGLRNDPGGD